MRDFPDALIHQAAAQLLLRHAGPWHGHAARTLVKTALMAVQEQIPSERFRDLVTATQHVGRHLDRVGEELAAVPWPIEDIQASIAGMLPPHAAGEAMIVLVKELAQRTKGVRLDLPTRNDWFGAVGDAMRRAGLGPGDISLPQRLDLAGGIEDLRMQRQQHLVEHACALIEVDHADICAALRGVLAARASATQPDHLDAVDQDLPRLDPALLEGLAALSAPWLRNDFRDWLAGLTPIAQHSARRRIEGLRAGSPLSRLWVKHILVPDRLPLHELKVIAERTHYRILFIQCPRGGLHVLSFGLRRDLPTLIERARSAAARLDPEDLA